ncbi:hypothetical protein SDC9_201072 [bioreactor metagenome]|uniref:Uncharacterized protein n=1 Tax=bioreactor metagenome TaxID=1076179 RepID=A0A645IPX7_9ZZZZ
MAARAFPVGLAHVLHVHRGDAAGLLRIEMDGEHLHRVAEPVWLGKALVVDLRFRAGVIGQQHAIERATAAGVDFDRDGWLATALARAAGCKQPGCGAGEQEAAAVDAGVMSAHGILRD